MKCAENTVGRGCISMNSSENNTLHTLSKFERQLCNIQGKMFELSAKKSLESANFIDFYMKSQTAKFFDLPYDRTQWLGEANLLQDVIDENPSLPEGQTFDNETLFWTGYIYRYWHFLTGESSTTIGGICNAETMKTLYPAYHTLDCETAILRIKEAK